MDLEVLGLEGGGDLLDPGKRAVSIREHVRIADVREGSGERRDAEER